MESFPLFFKIRVITFTCIMLFSFLWLVLLCVETFTRWSISDQINRLLVILFILTNTTTLVMLPILILVPFRIWLDTARLFLLFVLQVGSAAAGSVWSPRIQCPDETPDDLAVCQLIGVYTMIACWIIPTILAFYLTYFAAVVYLQSRIPVVVEARRSGVDLEKSSTGSLSSWSEKLKEIIGVQGSNAHSSVPPRPLVLPTIVHTRQSSLFPSSAPQHESTLPNAPHRQSTMPLPHTGQQPLHVLSSVPSRHHSLPAFKHGNGFQLCPPLALSIPRPLAINTSPSHPRTPDSHSHSTPSPANPGNQCFSFEPSVVDIHPPRDRRGISRHLSMMPLSSSPREMQSAERSLPIFPKQAKLLKPVPAHLL